MIPPSDPRWKVAAAAPAVNAVLKKLKALFGPVKEHDGKVVIYPYHLAANAREDSEVAKKKVHEFQQFVEKLPAGKGGKPILTVRLVGQDNPYQDYLVTIAEEKGKIVQRHPTINEYAELGSDMT